MPITLTFSPLIPDEFSKGKRVESQDRSRRHETKGGQNLARSFVRETDGHQGKGPFWLEIEFSGSESQSIAVAGINLTNLPNGHRRAIRTSHMLAE